MKPNKKLETINAKILELQHMQKQLEDDFILNISKQIAKILLKKKAYNINQNELLSKIEDVIDGLSSSK